MTRIIWRRAHQVRLPDKNTQVHAELQRAWIRDLYRYPRLLENWLAKHIERELGKERAALHADMRRA